MKKILNKTIYTVLLIITIALMSCGSVKQCDQIGIQFYNYLKAKQFEAIIDLLDKEALNASPAEVWLEGLARKDEVFGNVLNVERYDFESVTEDRVTRVGIKYKVIYPEATMFEKLEFVERDNEYKITFYKFDEDSLKIK
ncbi:MAG: hypothetical protein IKQ46_08755 [Bacteroidales bacterium]|nr:hypothetical protein [Bacteroidales bacterium]